MTADCSKVSNPPKQNSDMNWFYKQSDRELGPVSTATIQELANCGVITSTTLVRKIDSANWIIYEKLSGVETCEVEQMRSGDSLQFHCQGCGLSVSAGNDDSGKQAECPACSTIMTIPAQSLGSAAIVSHQSVSHPPKTAPPVIPDSRKNTSTGTVTTPSVVCNQKASTSSSTVDKAKKSHVKPVMIGCGAALLLGCLAVFGMLSVIVGAVNQTVSENSGSEQPIYSQPEIVVQQAPPFDPNTWNKGSPCRLCQGSGQRMEQCTRCRGNGTIMTGADSRWDPRNPSIQVACPQCRGGGRMQVRCSYCRGTGGN